MTGLLFDSLYKIDGDGSVVPSVAGGVAGLAVVDIDGDGVEDVVSAVRLVGSPRVDLWRLE